MDLYRMSPYLEAVVSKAESDLMAEHKALNPLYEGSPIADLPDYPELNDPPKDWDDWGPAAQRKTLREGIGDDLYDWLEGGKCLRK